MDRYRDCRQQFVGAVTRRPYIVGDRDVEIDYGSHETRARISAGEDHVAPGDTSALMPSGAIPSIFDGLIPALKCAEELGIERDKQRLHRYSPVCCLASMTARLGDASDVFRYESDSYA